MTYVNFNLRVEVTEAAPTHIRGVAECSIRRLVSYPTSYLNSGIQSADHDGRCTLCTMLAHYLSN